MNLNGIAGTGVFVAVTGLKNFRGQTGTSHFGIRRRSGHI
jgi:hypothetical protein